jgi:hypothetical protein
MNRYVGALIAASVLLELGLTISLYLQTGQFNIVNVSLSISALLLCGVPFKPKRR